MRRLLLFKDYKPLAFFSVVSVFLACLSLSAGYFPIAEYMDTGIVTRQPLAVLAASLGVLSTLAISVGLILDTSARYHREVFFLLAQNAERREPDGTHEAPPAL